MSNTSWNIQTLTNKQEKWLIEISETLDSWFVHQWYKNSDIKKWIKDIIEKGFYCKTPGNDANDRYRSSDIEWLNALRNSYIYNKQINN